MKKKYGLLSLILSIIIALSANLPGVVSLADENEGVGGIETGIFLPTSYLQYYKLDAPYAICGFKEDGVTFVAISHRNSIVIYRDEKFYSIPLADVNGQSVKTLGRYGKHLLYVYDGNLYTIDISGFNEDGWSPDIVLTDRELICSTFSINGNVLITSTGDNVYFNEIDDESDGFKIKDGRLRYKSFETGNGRPSTVLYSKNGKVYYDGGNSSAIYEYDVNGGEIRKIIDGFSNLTCLSDGGDGDDNIYFTCENGVYSFSPSGDEITAEEICKVDRENAYHDLGNIISPTGICAANGGLWVVDREINAVQEIDLENRSFTQFAITTNSKAVNRLSEKASDICIDKDTVYALDENRIVVINNARGEHTYNRIMLDNELIDGFSAGGGFVTYYADGQLKLIKMTDVGQPDLNAEIVFSTDRTPDGRRLDNVTDITFTEGVFYILRNTYDGATHPEVYRLNVANEDYALEKLNLGANVVGRGDEIAADVFGSVYFAATSGGNYDYYRFDEDGVNTATGKTEKIYSHEKVAEITNLQADFDGKLYCLFDDGKVSCHDGENEVFDLPLILSHNLDGLEGDDRLPRSMCLSCDSKTAYFIFAGLILKSSDEEQMKITTPREITIPENFSYSFSLGNKKYNVSENSRMFIVNGENVSGKYFDFSTYEISGDDKTEYIVIHIGGRYSLAVKDGVTAIVRNSDLINETGFDDFDGEGYAIVNFTAYTLPVLNNTYSGFIAERGDKLSIVGELDFNDVEYYIISNGKDTGYIPKNFIAFSFAEKRYSTDTYGAYVSGGTDVYSSEEMTDKTGVIDGKQKVTVMGEYGDALYVVYGDKSGYISKNAVIVEGTANAIRAGVIIVLALSLLVTALFLERRFFGK